MVSKIIKNGIGYIVKGTFSKDGLSKGETEKKELLAIHNQKKEQMRAYRKEVSRLAAVANKRLDRIKKKDLTDSPAYQRLIDDGIAKFGIRGKDHKAVQDELVKINRFINSETSTVRGMNKVLKDMAKNTGIKYKNMKELRKVGNNFFKLADKVEEYLRTVDDVASAIGYQKIWEVINEYVETDKIDLSSAENQIDSMVKVVTDMIKLGDSSRAGIVTDLKETDWFY